MFRKIVLALGATLALSASTQISATHYYDSLAYKSEVKNLCLGVNVYSNGWRYEMREFAKDDWIEAIEDVVEFYNEIYDHTSNVNFHAVSPYVYNGYSPSWCSSFVSVSFYKFTRYSRFYSAEGYAYQPINGRLQGIDINTAYLRENYNIELKAGLVGHELGHVLGLCHTGEGYCKPIS